MPYPLKAIRGTKTSGYKGDIATMFIAVVTQRVRSIPGAKWTVVYTAVEESASKAGSMAELQAAANRRANGPTYEYRTYVGTITHEVIPPEETVELRELKKDPELSTTKF